MSRAAFLTNNHQGEYLPVSRPETEHWHGYSSAEIGPDGARAVVLGRRLPWDTDVLGFPCGRIDALWADSREALPGLERVFDDVLGRMDADRIELCSVRVGFQAFSLIHLAEARGFCLVDVLNVFLSRNAPPPVCNEAFRITTDRGEIDQRREEALQIGAESFRHSSRLHEDPRIPENKAEAFYRRLLDHFLAKGEACTGIAVDAADRTAGFFVGLADERNQDLGYLWMMAASPLHRKEGLGRLLLNRFLREMHGRCRLVEIGTQVNNSDANRLYHGARLPVAANVASLHRWAT